MAEEFEVRPVPIQIPSDEPAATPGVCSSEVEVIPVETYVNPEQLKGGHAPEERPLSEVLEKVLHDLQTIFHDEMRLAACELKQKAKQSTKAAIFLAGAAVMGFIALECLIGTCIAALAIVLPVWLAILVIGIALGGAAGGAFLLGRMALEEVDPVPHLTVESLKDLGDWAKTRTR